MVLQGIDCKGEIIGFEGEIEGGDVKDNSVVKEVFILIELGNAKSTKNFKNLKKNPPHFRHVFRWSEVESLVGCSILDQTSHHRVGRTDELHRYGDPRLADDGKIIQFIPFPRLSYCLSLVVCNTLRVSQTKCIDCFH